MKVVSGIDLVFLPEFEKSLQSGGEGFLRRVFLPQELTDSNKQHLAGIFAAKEAVVKALGLPTDSWHDILIKKEATGRPMVIFQKKVNLSSYSVSISHHGEYVVAQFVGLV